MTQPDCEEWAELATAMRVEGECNEDCSPPKAFNLQSKPSGAWTCTRGSVTINESD